MNFLRVKGVVLRHLIYWVRSLNRLTDIFWWPLLTLLVWGLYTVYTRDRVPGITLFLLSGLVLWTIIQRAQYEISLSLMDDIWSENLLNIFATPLRFREFLLGLLLTSLVKLSVVVALMGTAAYFLYHYNLFIFGFHLLPFLVVLIIFGWTIGILVNSLIIRFGRDSEALAWTAVYLVQPLSCVFYPLSILPPFWQRWALLLPSTYIFEGMRSVVFSQTLPSFYFLMALFLSLLYFALSLFVFRYTLTKAKETGLLARLME